MPTNERPIIPGQMYKHTAVRAPLEMFVMAAGPTLGSVWLELRRDTAGEWGMRPVELEANAARQRRMRPRILVSPQRRAGPKQRSAPAPNVDRLLTTFKPDVLTADPLSQTSGSLRRPEPGQQSQSDSLNLARDRHPRAVPTLKPQSTTTTEGHGQSRSFAPPHLNLD